MHASEIISGKTYLAEMQWANGTVERCNLEVGAVDMKYGTVSAKVFHKDGQCRHPGGESFSIVQHIPVRWLIAEGA